MTSRAEIESFMHAVYAARQAEDIEATMRFIHPDCTFRLAGPESLRPMTDAVKGPEQIRALFEKLFADWDFAQFATDRLYVDGDTVVAHRRGIIRHTPTGKSVQTEIVDKVVLRDNLIVEFVEFVDTLAVAELVGLVPMR